MRVLLALALAAPLKAQDPVAVKPNAESSRMANHVTSRIRRVTSPQVAEPAPGPWSNCLVVNGVAYIAGMVARGNDGQGLCG